MGRRSSWPEKLFVQGNSYAGGGVTRFSCTRYGNVVGSRGSVIPLFKEQRRRGTITVTDERMTRFWLTLDQAVRFVARCLDLMQGGEVFVPKIPSMRLMDLAEAVAPDALSTWWASGPARSYTRRCCREMNPAMPWNSTISTSSSPCSRGGPNGGWTSEDPPSRARSFRAIQMSNGWMQPRFAP